MRHVRTLHTSPRMVNMKTRPTTSRTQNTISHNLPTSHSDFRKATQLRMIRRHTDKSRKSEAGECRARGAPSPSRRQVHISSKSQTRAPSPSRLQVHTFSGSQTRAPSPSDQGHTSFKSRPAQNQNRPRTTCKSRQDHLSTTRDRSPSTRSRGLRPLQTHNLIAACLQHPMCPLPPGLLRWTLELCCAQHPPKLRGMQSWASQACHWQTSLPALRIPINKMLRRSAQHSTFSHRHSSRRQTSSAQAAVVHPRRYQHMMH
mmetsp:Transcript_71601/g.130610  ORF Transcript_71601/g.130610 Transcript_71601/m.130610 type:complete len:259 (+) Transcript_71601:2410-3186(+)